MIDIQHSIEHSIKKILTEESIGKGQTLFEKHRFVEILKRQPHEGENLGGRIVAIPCKRVYGATHARHNALVSQP